MTDRPDNEAIEAVADAWALIDGKLYAFREGKKVDDIEAFGGHYIGYLCEAEELIKRVRKRGFDITPIVGTIQ